MRIHATIAIVWFLWCGSVQGAVVTTGIPISSLPSTNQAPDSALLVINQNAYGKLTNDTFKIAVSNLFATRPSVSVTNLTVNNLTVITNITVGGTNVPVINPTDGRVPYRSGTNSFADSSLKQISPSQTDMAFDRSVLINTNYYFLSSSVGTDTNTPNTFIGTYVAPTVTTGGGNYFSGFLVGSGITSGSNNVAVGQGAFANARGSGNTVVGFGAGTNLGSATSMLAVGFRSGYTATNGSGSTYVGANSGGSTTAQFASYSNTGVGASSLFDNTGTGNTAVGVNALNHGSGSYNTAVGVTAGPYSGDYNTIVGYSSMIGNTNGTHNAVLGDNIGNTGGVMTNVSYGTFLGSLSGPNAHSVTNQISIGYNAKVTNSSEIVLGNAYNTKLYTVPSVYLRGFIGATAADYSTLNIAHTGTNGAVVLDSQASGTAGSPRPIYLQNSTNRLEFPYDDYNAYWKSSFKDTAGAWSTGASLNFNRAGTYTSGSANTYDSYWTLFAVEDASEYANLSGHKDQVLMEGSTALVGVNPMTVNGGSGLGEGLWMLNSNGGTAGNPQNSPALIVAGRAWNTALGQEEVPAFGLWAQPFETGSVATADSWMSYRNNSGSTTNVFGVTHGGQIVLPVMHTPASSSEANYVGAMTWDANYIYVWTATNVNKRAALSTW